MTTVFMWGPSFDPGDSVATRQAADAERLVRELHDRIDRLTLVNYALWTMLQDKLGFTEAQLLERVRTVDLLDGRLDSRVKVPRELAKCESCSRTMSRRHPKCIYCGAENLTIGAFETVM